jgi:hypothetical protein
MGEVINFPSREESDIVYMVRARIYFLSYEDANYFYEAYSRLLENSNYSHDIVFEEGKFKE